jgi:hypothetical protein
MMPFPFHHVIAKPATLVPTNYYGCDPYNTVDAAEVRQRVIWSQMPARAFRTWTQVRSAK